MELKELNYYYNKFKFGEDIFHTLMQRRVREVLLVSTFYDAFIFEQDGRLSEQIFGEYHQLHLTSAPRITSVPTGEEALRKLQETRFDLVITMMRIGEVTPFDLARQAKSLYLGLPVLLLLNLPSDIGLIDKTAPEMQAIDNVFLWNGDSRIFLAMIKYIEDRLNVQPDTANGLVRVVLLVEDSIYFYSRFLPLLYGEIMLQTQRLISEELNDMQKIFRRRTRPKVLMAHSLEDAQALCEKYQEYLLCVISDIRYPNQGPEDPEAGLKLIRYLQDEHYDVSVLLQSSEDALAQKAEELNVSFLNKHSPSLLSDLSQFIHTNLGFGDFIFRDESGQEFDRAATLAEFENKLEHIPDETLLYHSRRNHFSAWLLARGEIQVAKQIRPLHVEDFGGVVEREREHLVKVFREVKARKTRGSIINFEADSPGEEYEIVRLAEGSLGGKGRGIAFLNALLVTMEFENRFSGAKIKIPKTAFIGTREFDLFMTHNNLWDVARQADDQQLKHAFLQASLSSELQDKLAAYLEQARHPIAARSSGLLEDSQSQPFAGIYQTFMLPNNHADKQVRQRQLEDAIKMIYASTFLEDARHYIERIRYRVEEEKMAVILQEIVGEPHNDYYYPHFSGVAQSYNYYPTSYVTHADGTASVALGLGEWVVDGEYTYRFCPRYPKLQILTPEALMKNSQTEFYAVNMRQNYFDLTKGAIATLSRLDLQVAEEDGVLWHIASVWDPMDHRIRDGLYYNGPRVITFANILRYNRFPLAVMLQELLEIGEKAFGVPVEIEFAANLTQSLDEKKLPTLYVLQIRPLSVHSEDMQLHLEEINQDELMLFTTKGMGNGVISNIFDIIYVDLNAFDNLKTLDMKQEIQALNERMVAEGREYILIGPGRWGTRDPLLGIPVHWADINNAKVIIETGLEGFVVEASQGTHFFHNLVAMNAGYFTVPYSSDEDFIDWDWLHAQAPYQRTAHFSHVRSATPLVIKMFGRNGVAVIYK